MDGLIFHIAEAKEWERACGAGAYAVSTRGRSLDEVGFIHCSLRHQVERVANAAYRGAGPLLLLAIDPARLGETELREEPAGGVETFPHLYGRLPVDAVVDVRALEPSPSGLFVPSTSWLSPKLVVERSPIDGLGLFAASPIAVDEPVSVIGGQVMTAEEFTCRVARVDRFSGSAVGEGFNVLQDRDDPLTRGNHSCEPNLWMVDELTLAARRPIAPREEATVDYALMTVAETWSMDCSCGATACRARISGGDWRLPELQARYRGHFSPFIERRVAARQRPLRS